MRTKPYDKREKYRCVLTILFDPVAGYQAQRDELARLGLSDAEIDAQVGPAPAPLDPTEKIVRALDYTFDVARRGNYAPLRFNTKDFAALYTAGSQQTAHIERRFHWSPAEDNRVSYFTVLYSGTARDLREEIAHDGFTFPDPYPDCQNLAIEAIGGRATGIVAPSKRDVGGNCCALFDRSNVLPGQELPGSTF